MTIDDDSQETIRQAAEANAAAESAGLPEVLPIVENGAYTSETAAPLLHCSKATIIRLCNSGRLDHQKLGTGPRAKILISGLALLKFLNAPPRAEARGKSKGSSAEPRRFIKRR